ncbi:unnamed protein product [Heligmosomoides polygyrus]|uniref:EGF-like domain-containing protein n=1 Tax=Heligmosomoides polygyrus TaxID=6339 RepID=A0A183FPK8_HELPZ|nr:unnamed protein product [Heligmosomoides polygyrus]
MLLLKMLYNILFENFFENFGQDRGNNTRPIVFFGTTRQLFSFQVATSCISSPQCGAASPCIRGECRDLWNAYSCECPLGFEGSLCEVNVDECSKTECGRGQCVDGIAGARCCGLFCQNRLRCPNSDDFSCVCDSGFTGEACDVEIDFCSLIPCKNGGSCSTGNGSYSCECKAGWTGKSCDIPVCYNKLNFVLRRNWAVIFLCTNRTDCAVLLIRARCDIFFD